jgi:hypothetical protein
MTELTAKMHFETKRGQGLFIRDIIQMNVWNIAKETVLESPLSFGSTSANVGG